MYTYCVTNIERGLPVCCGVTGYCQDGGLIPIAKQLKRKIKQTQKGEIKLEYI